MSRVAMEQLMDEWINNPSFRTELRNDPEGTVRARNVDLNEDEWSALRAIDWSLPDEALQARVSKVA